MIVEKSSGFPFLLEGLVVFEHKPHKDMRGHFAKLYTHKDFQPFLGGQHVVQVNHSFTELPGTVRGFHFQHPPFSEIKIVTCVKGAIQDVVVDIRQGSPTFLESFSLELSEENSLSLLIPSGFAHGFQSLLPNTELIYCHTEEHHPEYEDGLNVLDPKFKVAWPLEVRNLSDRDSSHKFVTKEFRGF